MHKISEEMHRAAVEARGKFDAADQIEPGRARHRFRAVVAGQRIVIGDGQRLEARRYCRIHQFSGAVGPVRFVGMGVKIDQKEISPRAFSLAQTFSALCSGVSASERITTSGRSGGSYGSETPVNCGISPAMARLYRPLTSRP